MLYYFCRRDVVDGKHVGGTDDPFEFQLGREKVIKGWDIGVATMNIGETARFIIAPEYAYGSKGFAPKVEPDETLDFEIELLKFKVRVLSESGLLSALLTSSHRNLCRGSRPKPSSRRRAESRPKKKRRCLKRTRHRPSVRCESKSPLVILEGDAWSRVFADERIAIALEAKEQGNACVAKQEYDKAQKHYDSVSAS
jgi:hypothetical protein